MPTFNAAFQYIIDNASAVSINGRGTVAQTITRTGVVRAVSRGGRTWKFVVTPAAGLVWNDARAYIARLDQMDRIQTATINFDRTEFVPIVGYRGDGTAPFTAVVPSGGGTQVFVSATSLPAGGRVARAGDYIQIGPVGSVYQVVVDPNPGNSAIVTLNRPVDENAGPYTAYMGTSVRWTVICTDMPSWRLIPGGPNQLVEWSGDFVFYEDRT